MKKISSILATLPLITTACSGGGGGSPSSDNTTIDTNTHQSIDLSQQQGIWSSTETQTTTSASGKQTTFQAPTGIVTSNQKMMILTGNSELFVIEPNASIAHYFSSFAYNTDISATTELSNTHFTFNYYNPKTDTNSEVAIPVDGHYDAAIDLNNLAGIWDDEYDTNNSWQFTINTDGSFTADKQSAGCTATGNFSHIDTSKSELSVSITFNSQCGNLINTHSGLAWPDETHPNGKLNIAVYNGFELSSKAIGWKIIKQ